GLLECLFRPSAGAIAPEPSTPAGVQPTEYHGNDLGVKQPLAERKLVLSDSPSLGPGPGVLSSPDAGHTLGPSSYAPSRSRQRRQSLMEAGEALNTTLEMARQRRQSSNHYDQSTSGQGGKGFMNWGWLGKGANVSKQTSPKRSSRAEHHLPADQLPAPPRQHPRGRDGSLGTGELLQRRGFPVHYAKDIHKSVSTSTTKPIAVLGLEPSTDAGGDAGVAMDQGQNRPPDGPEAQSRRNHNKLFPLYVNGVAKTYFKISASRDYAGVLRRLLRRDPLLTFALQKAIKNLSVGDCKPVSHVTSDPTGASASLYGLRITPCVWSDTNGHKLPALLLEHNVPYESQDVMPRLLRDYAVLSHVPSILTLIDFNGHVLYQNAASIDYCGDLTSHNVETGDGMMGVLYQYEPQMLQEMLQEVNEGNYWQQVVRVPASLKRHMIFETEGNWSLGGGQGVILLLQTNVTARVELENRLADLTDAQLGMLEQLFPRHVIEYMLSHKHGYNSRNLTHLANHHDDVIVLFTDVVGFTSMSKEVEPSEVMHFLNELYTIFDDLVDLHDLYKLDTVGDCYIVVAGLTMQDDDGFTCTVQGDNEQSRLQNAQVMMDFAKAILRESKQVARGALVLDPIRLPGVRGATSSIEGYSTGALVPQVFMPHNNMPVQIRIGIHIGSLASGLVGPKMPKFTLFGRSGRPCAMPVFGSGRLMSLSRAPQRGRAFAYKQK
ncbi:Atrial natriuretic peptide receptor 1, partial [Tetrabaena socialis]